jgi:hypothetical protein
LGLRLGNRGDGVHQGRIAQPRRHVRHHIDRPHPVRSGRGSRGGRLDRVAEPDGGPEAYAVLLDCHDLGNVDAGQQADAVAVQVEGVR